MNETLVQSQAILRSMRPREGGPWVKKWEFGLGLNLFTIVNFFKKLLKNPCLLAKYLHTIKICRKYIISANVKKWALHMYLFFLSLKVS